MLGCFLWVLALFGLFCLGWLMLPVLFVCGVLLLAMAAVGRRS